MTAALQELGFDAVHYPYDTVTQRELRRHEPLSVLETHDAITDISVAPFYPYLADLYPNADHDAAVRSHFADTPSRLLDIDVSDDHAWSRLAGFLGVETPAGRFPHHNEGQPRGV